MYHPSIGNRKIKIYKRIEKKLLEVRLNRNSLYLIHLLTYNRNPDIEFQSRSSCKMHDKSYEGQFLVFPTFLIWLYFCSQIIHWTSQYTHWNNFYLSVRQIRNYVYGLWVVLRSSTCFTCVVPATLTGDSIDSCRVSWATLSSLGFARQLHMI
jgi:hypothetical protein